MNTNKTVMQTRRSSQATLSLLSVLIDVIEVDGFAIRTRKRYSRDLGAGNNDSQGQETGTTLQNDGQTIKERSET